MTAHALRLQQLGDVPATAPPAAGRVPVWDGGKFVWGGAREIGDYGVDDFYEERQLGDVCTMPSFLAGGFSLAFSQGFVYGALARCKKAGTYSKVRYLVNLTPVGATDFKIGVADTTGARVAQTANLGNPVANGYETALDVPVTLTLTLGQWLYLTIGMVGASAGQVLGIPGNAFVNAKLNRAGFALCRSASGWAGGNLPTLGTIGGVGNRFWIELIP